MLPRHAGVGALAGPSAPSCANFHHSWREACLLANVNELSCHGLNAASRVQQNRNRAGVNLSEKLGRRGHRGNHMTRGRKNAEKLPAAKPAGCLHQLRCAAAQQRFAGA